MFILSHFHETQSGQTKQGNIKFWKWAKPAQNHLGWKVVNQNGTWSSFRCQIVAIDWNWWLSRPSLQFSSISLYKERKRMKQKVSIESFWPTSSSLMASFQRRLSFLDRWAQKELSPHSHHYSLFYTRVKPTCIASLKLSSSTYSESGGLQGEWATQAIDWVKQEY